MKQIAQFSIRQPLYTWLIILISLLGGAFGYINVGKLEDPVFTLKEALVITAYPGATAAEVAMEVSEPLESEIQKMDEVKTVTSRNLPGISIIEVEMREQYDAADLPQVWDDLRDRVADARSSLPAGAATSEVNDDFGDVFGVYYAVTAPGYPDSDVWEIANFLRRELLAVEGVANAEILGLPEEAVFVEPDTRLLKNLSIPPAALVGAINASTAVVPTGTATLDGHDVGINGPKAEDSVRELQSITLGAQGQTVRLDDFAKVHRDRVEQPRQIVRFNGEQAFTIGIAGLTSQNIVNVGHAIENKIDAIAVQLPVGVTLEPIYEQHRVVDEANAGFLKSLVLSVAVVIGVLALAMGWRAALVVGTTLLLTVTGTFLAMYFFDIKVERISLGALIIAMGMLVDNAIVVAEGLQMRMRQGIAPDEAAGEIAGKTGWPLLGATVIGIMAFAGIGLSSDATGEFLFSLFAVIGLSLTLSWFFAVTITPFLSACLFKVGDLKDGQDPYGGAIFRGYGWLVRGTIRMRWFVIIASIGLTLACVGTFSSIKQQFFPPSSTPVFYLDYKASQGTSVHTTSADLRKIENWLLERDDVVSVTASAGQGFTRFLLTYEPEAPDASYGQLIIRTQSSDAIPRLRRDLDIFTAEQFPHALIGTKRIIYGPTIPADIEVRFSGPDPDVLRDLGDKALQVLRTATPDLHSEAIDWHERSAVIRPIFAETRAQAVGIAREDVATAIALSTDGVSAGVYRERDRLIPIVVRRPRDEMGHEGALLEQIVWSPTLNAYTSFVQAVDGFEVVSRDRLIERRNRVPTLTVQANVVEGLTPPTVFARIREPVEAIHLPPGYSLSWGGEFESAGDAQRSLGKQMPMSFGIMLLITILLFGKVRQTAVIWTIVPMAVNGVAIGLVYSGFPFSFTALLGLLSLSGMLIKNAIVLVEEIDVQKQEGLPQDKAIEVASVSRLRPVILAAATTILGMAPLLWDSFFAAMAVTIMGGLGFASVLTLIVLPALYQTYVRDEMRPEPEMDPTNTQDFSPSTPVYRAMTSHLAAD